MTYTYSTIQRLVIWVVEMLWLCFSLDIKFRKALFYFPVLYHSNKRSSKIAVNVDILRYVDSKNKEKLRLTFILELKAACILLVFLFFFCFCMQYSINMDNVLKDFKTLSKHFYIYWI